jgi:hypothetical protein
MDLSELLAKHDQGGFLLGIAEAMLQLIVETDVEGIIGAGRQECRGGAHNLAQRVLVVSHRNSDASISLTHRSKVRTSAIYDTSPQQNSPTYPINDGVFSMNLR